MFPRREGLARPSAGNAVFLPVYAGSLSLRPVSCFQYTNIFVCRARRILWQTGMLTHARSIHPILIVLMLLSRWLLARRLRLELIAQNEFLDFPRSRLGKLSTKRQMRGTL